METIPETVAGSLVQNDLASSEHIGGVTFLYYLHFLYMTSHPGRLSALDMATVMSHVNEQKFCKIQKAEQRDEI